VASATGVGRTLLSWSVRPLHLCSKLLTGIPDLYRWQEGKKEGKKVIGASVYHPSLGKSSMVEPSGAGIANTIGWELEAKALQKIENNCCTQRRNLTCSRTHPQSSPDKTFITLFPTTSFINLNTMLELPVMNVQTPLPNTKPAT